MKIGSFKAIYSSPLRIAISSKSVLQFPVSRKAPRPIPEPDGPESAVPDKGRRPDRDHRISRQFGQGHAIEDPADARLDPLDRPAKVASRELGAIIFLGHAADDPEGTFESPDDLPHRDLPGVPRQRIAALRAVVARDERLLGQTLEDLGQALGRDVELLRDALGTHRSFVAMGRDEVYGHQSVVSALRELEHPVPL